MLDIFKVIYLVIPKYDNKIITNERIVDITGSVTQSISFAFNSLGLQDISRQVSQSIAFGNQGTGSSFSEYLRVASQSIAMTISSEPELDILRQVTQEISMVLDTISGKNIVRYVSQYIHIFIEDPPSLPPGTSDVESAMQNTAWTLATFLPVVAIIVALASSMSPDLINKDLVGYIVMIAIIALMASVLGRFM